MNGDLERIEELYEFLQGNVPEGMHMKCPPRLSKRKAFRIIYFLQEHMGLLPDNIERCISCDELFDTHNEGIDLRCDDCRRD